MKKQIRQNVFETNSSSVHSLTITNKDLSKNEMTITNSLIKVPVLEFGWGTIHYTSQLIKLSYLVMMTLETEGRKCKSVKEFYNTKGFKSINDAIGKYCNCKGIILPDLTIETVTPQWANGEKHSYIEHNGYIDHQSTDDFTSLSKYLDDCGVGILEYVFGSDIVLHISNDNI